MVPLEWGSSALYVGLTTLSLASFGLFGSRLRDRKL